MSTEAPPPLTGLKVVELAGLAPGPFCGVLLSTYGASVLRIDRPNTNPDYKPAADLLTSHKASIPLDLKNPSSLNVLKTLLAKSDVLIDPYRPGVLKKLGLDPHDVLLKLNPRLVIVSLTGFRKDGKYKDMAGHDINYLAACGVLSLLGPNGLPPFPPGNLLADFAGGGLVAFTGVLLALIHRSVSGKGQVVDANMVDGVSFIGAFPRLLQKTPMWNRDRGTNTLDGGSPYYGCYECKDKGRYVSVGALEPQFFAQLLKGLGLKEEDVVPKGSKLHRLDNKSWDHMRKLFENKFRSKTRDEWEKIFDGTDACVVPVKTMSELEEENYELRPMVGLERSPGLKMKDEWEGKGLQTGEGGEEMLQEWMGWKKGQQFDENEKGAIVLKEKSKL